MLILIQNYIYTFIQALKGKKQIVMNHIEGSALVKRRTVQCHYCEYSCEKIQSNMAKCCIKRCNKNFCYECIIKHFNKEFTMDMYKKDTWICFCCQQSCNCEKCKSYELGSAQKIKKKRGPKSHKVILQNQQQLQKQADNNSPKNSKQINQKSQQIQQDIQKQLYSQPRQLQQIQNFQQYKIYEADEMILFPAHYKKRITQKHFFCKFVVQAYRQSKEKKDEDKKQLSKQPHHKLYNTTNVIEQRPAFYRNLFHQFNSKSQ